MELTNDDVQSLLDTLVYDGKIEEYHDPREQVKENHQKKIRRDLERRAEGNEEERTRREAQNS
jgi:hypothetical protein